MDVLLCSQVTASTHSLIIIVIDIGVARCWGDPPVGPSRTSELARLGKSC